MEFINFAGALRRSWRLLLALALVGAVIGAFLPIKPIKEPKPILHWKAVAVVGAAPKGGDGLVSGGVTGPQILFYANSIAVQAATAKASGQDIKFDLARYMTASLGELNPKATSTSTSTPAKGKNSSNVVTLAGYGKTKAAAVQLVNTYALVLEKSIAAEATARQQALDLSKPANKATPTNSGSPATTPGSSVSPSASSTTTPVNTGFIIVSDAGSATHVLPSNGGLLHTKKVRALLGLLVGLLVGAVIVIARSMLDKRIRTAPQTAHAFGFPVIVEIPAPPTLSADERAAPVDAAMQPGSVEAEAFRMLRMSVLFEGLADTAAVADPLVLALGGNGHGAFGSTVPVVPELGRREPGDRHIVLIASPGGEETRPAIAANLAAVYAEAGQRVIVASTADLGVGQPVVMGDSEALLFGDIHPVDVEARLQPTWVDNVVRLPFTMFLRNSGQLVSRGKELLDTARSISDVIIVETPGLLSVHHAEALSRTVDVMVVVGECGTTRIADARTASDLLRRIGAPILGVVLTNVRSQGRVKASRLHARTGPIAVPSAPTAPANGAVSPRSGWDEPTAKTQV